MSANLTPEIVSNHVDNLVALVNQLRGNEQPHILALDYKLESIDSRLTDAVIGIRGIRNAALPVMQLPPEVLGAIFRSVQELVRTSCRRTGFTALSDVYRHPSFHSWMTLRLVCRHWHDVCRSFPSLWRKVLLKASGDTRIMELHANLVDLHLRHLEFTDFDLIVFGNVASPLYDGILTRISSHIGRMRHFSLILAGECLPSLQNFLVEREAPKLQALSLDISPALGGSHHLSTLFGGTFPALQSLRLHPFTGYGQNSFKHLKQLHLDRLHYKTTACVQSLFRLLEANPSLEDVMLHDVRVQLASLLSLGTRRCRLPSLRRLHLSEVTGYQEPNVHRTTFNTKAVACFLASLKLSPGVQILMKGNYGAPLGELLNALFALTSEEFKKVQLIAFHSHYIWQVAGDASAFRIETTFTRATDAPPLVAPDIDALASSSRELWTGGSGWPSLKVPVYILQHCEYAERLYLSFDAPPRNGGSDWWLMALGPDPTTVSCPLLRELHLINPNIHAHFHTLARALSIRKERGLGLKAIHIYVSSSFERNTADRSRGGLDQWRAAAPEGLQQFAEEIIFHCTESPVRMELPPVCYTPSSNIWAWPVWAEP